jgi:hypothetical protein
MALSKAQKSLKNWTKEDWGTKSGKPSNKTGERYLPKKAREALSSAEYAATTAAKRKGTASGKQFVKQPKKIAEKTAKFRASKGGLTMNKMKMVDKNGKKVPFYAADGIGKMNKGGMMKKKGYAKGGMKKKGYAAGGKVMTYNIGGMVKSTGTINTGIKKGS